MHLENLSRIGVRLPVRSPPSSLALTLLTNNNFVARLHALVPMEPVLKIGALLATFTKPTENADQNLLVICK